MRLDQRVLYEKGGFKKLQKSCMQTSSAYLGQNTWACCACLGQKLNFKFAQLQAGPTAGQGYFALKPYHGDVTYLLICNKFIMMTSEA